LPRLSHGQRPALCGLHKGCEVEPKSLSCGISGLEDLGYFIISVSFELIIYITFANTSHPIQVKLIIVVSLPLSTPQNCKLLICCSLLQRHIFICYLHSIHHIINLPTCAHQYMVK
jgi:hypothetical protein